MNTDFFAFGEILWDCLPTGRHAGGAPFNVAASLAQLGGSVALISSLGMDVLGDEMLQVAGDKGVDTRFITRARDSLATGTVQVTVDEGGNATYDIVEPVAWDEIQVSEEALAAVAGTRALVFGSLAGRSPHNLEQLDRLLRVKGPLRFFDINLRPPFVDLPLVVELAKRADVLKLNDDEAGLLACWLRTGGEVVKTPRDVEALAEACRVIAEATYTERICITRGAEGAALWDHGTLLGAAAPPVEVRDTVGAGDAFMAGLVWGLTAGAEMQRALEEACRLGAFVASQHGATPLFPTEWRAELGLA